MNLHSPLSIVCLWTVLFSVCLMNQSRLPAQDQENQPSAETGQAQKAEALKRAKQGQTYLKQKHWKKAISEFQAAVKLQPENSMLHYLLSVSYLEDSQGSLAWIEVRKAVLLDLKNQNAMQQFLKFWSFFDKQGVLNVGTPEVEVLKLLGSPDRKQEQGADTRLTYGFMWLTLRNASLFAVIDTRGLEAEYTKALQTMEFELGPDWRVGYRLMNGTSALTEYVTTEETVQKYQQLFSTQRLFKLGKETSAEDMMKRMKSLIEQSYEVETWTVIDDGQDDVIFEWKVAASDKTPAQHEINRIVRGKRDIHRLAYVTRKLPLSEADRKKWIDELKSARVVLANPGKQPLTPEQKAELVKQLTTKSREIIALQLKYIQAGDVESMRPFFTERLRDRITKESLAEAKEQAASATPEELVHSVTIEEVEDGIQAKIKMKNGRTLTTLVPVNRKWEADTIWFK